MGHRGGGGRGHCQLFAYTYVLSTMYVHVCTHVCPHHSPQGGEDTFGWGRGGQARPGTYITFKNRWDLADSLRDLLLSFSRVGVLAICE